MVSRTAEHTNFELSEKFFKQDRTYYSSKGGQPLKSDADCCGYIQKKFLSCFSIYSSYGQNSSLTYLHITGKDKVLSLYD